MLQTLGATEIARPTYRWQQYFDFVAAFVFEAFARPFAVGMSSIALVFGGWIVAVNAASGSVPGDAFYPVKIATERVQMTFTTSSTQRTKLHMEFAGRRLDEVSTVQRSDRSGKTVRVQNALENFRKELVSAQTEISSISEKNPEVASEMAKYVNEKTNAYASVIRESVATSGDSHDDVKTAQTENDSVNQEAVKILVDQQSSSLNEKSNIELKALFRHDLEDIHAQRAIVRSRLETIRRVIESREDLSDEMRDNAIALIVKIQNKLLEVDPKIDEVTNVLAAGGYLRTFEVMNDLKATMNTAHELVAQLEIQLSTSFVPTPSVSDGDSSQTDS